MLRIGKLLDAENEKVNVKVSTLQSMHFEDGKKTKTEERPELEIEIEGIVNGDSYYFDFYIQKPFQHKDSRLRFPFCNRNKILL